MDQPRDAIKGSHRNDVTEAEFIRFLSLVFWSNLTGIFVHKFINKLSQLGIYSIIKNRFEKMMAFLSHLDTKLDYAIVTGLTVQMDKTKIIN